MDHEYSLLGGVNRAQIGRYISIAAAAISGAIVFLVLSAIDIAKKFGLPANLPPTVLSLISAGTVFTVLYMIFNKYAWCWKYFSMFLKVPNLKGSWDCKGSSLSVDGEEIYSWDAEVTILQSWDKIRIRLKTSQSGSNSITAAIVHDEAEGFRLLYNYKNDPKLGEPELHSHIGFADILFSKTLDTAEGEYYNGYGRQSFGKLKLTRSKK